jgi:hypothetical protein
MDKETAPTNVAKAGSTDRFFYYSDSSASGRVEHITLFNSSNWRRHLRREFLNAPPG